MACVTQIIEEKLKQLSLKRPLTAGEVERINEEFTIEFTYIKALH